MSRLAFPCGFSAGSLLSEEGGIYRPFPSLETIMEESEIDLGTNSDPSSPTSSTGPWVWGWGFINSDEDSTSVIYMEDSGISSNFPEFSNDVSGADQESLERSPSITESLFLFEILEKSIIQPEKENFPTSATSLPFEDSNFAFQYADEISDLPPLRSWSSLDSFMSCNSCRPLDYRSVSDNCMLELETCVSTNHFKNFGRHFDDLSDLNQSDSSLGSEDDPESLNRSVKSYRSYGSLHLMESGYPVDKKLQSLISIEEETEDLESGQSSGSSSPENDEKINNGKASKLGRSAEALSEDSGYGDASLLRQASSPKHSNPSIENSCTCKCTSLVSKENNQIASSYQSAPFKDSTCSPDRPLSGRCLNDDVSTQTTETQIYPLLQRVNPKKSPVIHSLRHLSLGALQKTAITPNPHDDATHDLNWEPRRLSPQISSQRCGKRHLVMHSNACSKSLDTLDSKGRNHALQLLNCSCANICNIWGAAEIEISADDGSLSGLAKNSVNQKHGERLGLARQGGEGKFSLLPPPRCSISGNSDWQIAASHNSADSGENVTLGPDADENTIMDVSKEDNYAPRVPLKRYGPHQEVEVFISKQHGGVSVSSTPSPVPPATTKGVHFSPIVSTVNWRESYLETDSETELQEGNQKDQNVKSAVQVVRITSQEVRPQRPQTTSVSPTESKVKEKVSLQRTPTNGKSLCEKRADKSESGMAVSAQESATETNTKTDEKMDSKKEKQTLFHRFSFARISARMSATFSRHNAPVSSKSDAQQSVKNESNEKRHKHKSKNKSDQGRKTKSLFFFRRKSHRAASSPPALGLTPVPCNPEAHPKPSGNPPEKGEQIPALEKLGVPQADNLTSISSGDQSLLPEGLKDLPEVVRSDPEVHEDFRAKSEPVVAATLPRGHGKPPLPPQTKPRAARRNYLVSVQQEGNTPPTPVISSTALQHALEHFRESARQDRERIAKSVQDLADIDKTARSAVLTTSTTATTPFQQQQEYKKQDLASRAESVENVWNATLTRAAQTLPRSSRNRLEISVDDDPTETNLDDLINSLEIFAKVYGTKIENSSAENNIPNYNVTPDKKYKSMLNLGSSNTSVNEQTDLEEIVHPRIPDNSRAKSMEFLLADENKTAVQPPENQLMKSGERQVSEYELRIQKSLQRIAVPEWFKNAQESKTVAKPILRTRQNSTSSVRTGWSGVSMTSLSSGYGSNPAKTAGEPQSLPFSSPRELPGSGEASSQFRRWGSSSYRCSVSPGPTLPISPRSGQSKRLPYLGWRSQEKLHHKPLSVYQSPAERLALSLSLPVENGNAYSTPGKTDRDESSCLEINQTTPALPPGAVAMQTTCLMGESESFATSFGNSDDFVAA